MHAAIDANCLASERRGLLDLSGYVTLTRGGSAQTATPAKSIELSTGIARQEATLAKLDQNKLDASSTRTTPKFAPR